MVTVEGVARRIDPDNDLWAAAQPVVERWMTRELSPLNKAREAIEEMLRAARAIVRLAEAPAATVEVERPRDPLLKWAVGLGAAATLLAAAALVLQLVG